MASSLCSFLLALAALGALISPATSLSCSSQKFGNRVFDHCADLPHLDAFVHWTHDSANSSLSVAFRAPPASSGGWVAWAVNPTATGMAGSQAFLAFLSDGAVTVRTFNISSYSVIMPSPKLAFEFWDLKAEHSDGKFTIFVTVKVPATAKSVNQVWQVGSAVNRTSGAPAVHEFKPANLNAKGVLAFDKVSVAPSPGSDGDAPARAPAPTEGTAGAGTGAGRDEKSGGSRNMGIFVGLFVMILGIIGF